MSADEYRKHLQALNSISDALKSATAVLREAGIDSPQADAEMLIAFALSTSRIEVIVHPERQLTEIEREKIRFLISERARRFPMAYLTGVREFWSFELDVTPAVLIPRQETEILVESVIKHFEGKTAAIADIGAGSGAICIALAKELPEAGVYATEVSREAMEVAQRNVDKHQLGDRVSLLYGDLLHPLEEAGLKGRLNAVVSNPPYIPSGEIDGLQPEVRFEPRGALDGGPDGLDVIRRLLRESPEYLVPGGMFFTEIGFDQGEAVKELAVRAGFRDVSVVKDLAGLDRVVCGKMQTSPRVT